MNLETKWLEDLVALAAVRSFSAAARKRYVTQPAFSRRIRSLEQAVGACLVDRSTTPVSLTTEGQLFLVTARHLVSHLNDCIDHLHGLESANEKLDVAAAHSLALAFYPKWISRLRKGVGELPTRLLAMNVGDAIHLLREGNCDLMLAFSDSDETLQLDSEAFPSFLIGHAALLPVVAPDAKGKPRYSLDNQGGDAPQGLPFLSYTPDALLGRTIRSMLNNRPIRHRLRTVYETAMAEGLKAMAVQGNGIAWIPDFSAQDELEAGRLVRAGGEQWDIPLEVRLYRCSLVHKPGVEQLWKRLQKLPRDMLKA